MYAGYYQPYWLKDDELEHYGVLGMKRGVRRYQNYDGTYTKKGLERYNKASEAYEKSKANKKSLKSVGGTQYKQAKAQVKRDKQSLKKAYKRLKQDKMADQGKELYKSGKTITDNMVKHKWAEIGVVVGGNVASAIIAEHGSMRLASMAGPTIAIGGTAINAILAARTRSQNKKLRAYYAH